MNSNPIIIPIASGKGGVGKSFLTANLAMALASMGHHTLAVDLDLGGSNLHDFLGVPNRHPGIGDFLKAKRAELHQLRVKTKVPHLEFLPGDGKTPFMANISHTQKFKLIAQIQQLPADYILLDLGAGTDFNTLDFFALSDRGIMVTAPERQAIMNMLTFLKNFLLREIEKSGGSENSVKNLIAEAVKKPLESQVSSVKELLRQISGLEPGIGKKAAQQVSRFRPRIVFNEGYHPDDLKLTTHITKSLQNVLSMEADYFGFIFFDPAVRNAIRRQQPFLPANTKTPAARAIHRIAERIIKYWDRPIPNSAALLKSRIQQDF